MRRFQELARKRRHIMFYSEGGASWVHLGPLIRQLVAEHDFPLCYLSSEPDDPGLDYVGRHGASFVIGKGAVRNVLFKSFPAGLLVMTMPDIETFHIKRSVNAVHYVYVHHSLISTHMVYLPQAFDNFETIFCVGPHHVDEIRAREQQYGLPAKQLFEHGYGRLDSILARASAPNQAEDQTHDRPLRVLLAPSWGPHGLLETQGVVLAGILLRAGLHLTVRPHPQTGFLSPRVISELRGLYGEHAAFELEQDITSEDSLFASDIMISDWSGAAMEFAFGLERPVLFINVPRKMRNPDYQALGIEPLEARVRHEIGDVLSVDKLEEAPERIRKLTENRQEMRARIRASCRHWVYNLGQSGARGAAELASIARNIAHLT